LDLAERNIAHGEAVEKELDNFIRHRDQKRRESGEERRVREAWQESADRQNLQVERDELIARYLYHRAHRGRIGRMASGLMAEHDAAAQYYAAKLATKHGVNVEVLEDEQEESA
jgi:hypothetical protein